MDAFGSGIAMSNQSVNEDRAAQLAPNVIATRYSFCADGF